MDRLTAQWGENHAVPTKFDLEDFAMKLENPEWDGFTKILDRLAAYESTGLEPDEIPHWIPVSERLPKKPQDCICFFDDGSVAICWSNGEPYKFRPDVTHWMPRPIPPKEEK